MNNYFTSYNSLKQKEYIIPEISIRSITEDNHPQVEKVPELENPIAHATDIRDTYKVKLAFRPYTIRISHPIDLSAFIWDGECFYEVTEGLYMLDNGTVKLKVMKKYGRH